jgi:hypothetical protein
VTLSRAALISFANAIAPATGTVARLILLSGAIASNLVATANPVTNELSAAIAHGLATGSRVRLSSTNMLPTPLVSTMDYWAIVTSPTDLQLASTLDNATAGTFVDLMDAGTGALVINEQPLTGDDAIAVLVNKEISAIARTAVDLPASTYSNPSSRAQRQKSLAIPNVGTTAVNYRHCLVAFGASSSTGSTVGITGWYLHTLPATQSIAAGEGINVDLSLWASRA